MTRFENQVAVVTGAGRGLDTRSRCDWRAKEREWRALSRTEANAQRTADEINASRNDAAKAYAWMFLITLKCRRSESRFWPISGAPIFWSTMPA